jgi:hypothetical protein
MTRKYYLVKDEATFNRDELVNPVYSLGEAIAKSMEDNMEIIVEKEDGSLMFCEVSATYYRVSSDEARARNREFAACRAERRRQLKGEW